MSTENVNDIIEEFAEAFDEIREELLDENTRCFLLKRKTDSQKLETVKELTAGWLVEFNEFRGQMVLSYATVETNFANDIAQSSFVGYGIPDADNEIEVFGIDPDRRDVVAPNGTSPFWKVYVAKIPEERFTVS